MKKTIITLIILALPFVFIFLWKMVYASLLPLSDDKFLSFVIAATPFAASLIYLSHDWING